MGKKIAFGSIIFVNLILAFLMYYSTHNLKGVFDELLEGEPLPTFTEFSLVFANVWPSILIIVSTVFIILSKKISTNLVIAIIAAMLLVDLVLFFMTAAGLCLPLIQVVDRLS